MCPLCWFCFFSLTWDFVEHVSQRNRYTPPSSHLISSHLISSHLISSHLIYQPHSLLTFCSLRHTQVGEPCVCRLSRVLEKNGGELRSLILAENKLHQLPGAVFELPHLQVLDLSGNAMREIPEDVIKLKSLKVLDVTNNPIDGIPKNVARHFYGATEIRWDGSK